MNSKKTNPEEIPFVVKVIVNLIATFGLSLSIYLLIVNVMLTATKMQGYFGKNIEFSTSLDSVNDQIQEQIKKKYYDCTHSILSVDECDLINKYHYLNIFKFDLYDNLDLEVQSLKVNTSLYTY